MGYQKLIQRINNRRAIVDEMLPPILAERLRLHGAEAYHIHEIGYAGMPDSEIAAMMQGNDVLVTRDYQFYKSMGDSRAILLKLGWQVQEHKWKPFKPWVAKEESRKRLESPLYFEVFMKNGFAMLFGVAAMKRCWNDPWDFPNYEGNPALAASRPKGRSCDYMTRKD